MFYTIPIHMVKVLLVEDESKVASFISKGLQEEGYAVDVAYDGRRGLEFINEFTYDIILLDLMIPEINGLEVLKQMRDAGMNTPVLIITAKTSKEDVVKGLDTGSDDYLTKPFSFDELLARMRALLRRSRQVVPLSLEYKSIVLDPYSRKLRAGSREEELTEKEFLVMEFMLKNAEKTPAPKRDLRVCVAESGRFIQYHRRLRKFPTQEDGAPFRQTLHPHGPGCRLYPQRRA